VQLLAFILFLFLAVRAGQTAFAPGGQPHFPPADLFYRLDPLAGAAGMLAARRIIPALLVGAIVALLAAVVLGRVWCGWLCPLGTVLDWTPSRRARPKEADLSPRWRSVKYILLIAILVMAALGNLALIFLDPITLTYRTFATAVWPAFNALLTRAEFALYPVPLLQPVIDGIESLRGSLLPSGQPGYAGGIIAALLFGGVLALNAVRARFWCRYLCPLGAMLGLASKLAIIRRRVSSSCTSCAQCARTCPVGTIDPARNFASDPSECTVCLDCVPACRAAGQAFGRGGESSPRWTPAPWQSYDPSRRQFLASAGAAIAGVGLLAVDPAAARPHPHLVRPPGSVEPLFSATCIRCGLCVRTCPTSGLQPELAGAGWQSTWTPALLPRLGYCDYGCNACGQICPTGAIPALSLEEKQVTVIGQAYIDRDRCIPWVDNVTCLVCEEMCPLPEKAIKLDDVMITLEDGSAVAVRRPYVVHDRCIGCGICEYRCPLSASSAIRVYTPSIIGVA
jgi:polyferredoxin